MQVITNAAAPRPDANPLWGGEAPPYLCLAPRGGSGGLRPPGISVNYPCLASAAAVPCPLALPPIFLFVRIFFVLIFFVRIFSSEFFRRNFFVRKIFRPKVFRPSAPSVRARPRPSAYPRSGLTGGSGGAGAPPVKFWRRNLLRGLINPKFSTFAAATATAAAEPWAAVAKIAKVH